MTKMASYTNCKRLYELTKWEDANAIWGKYSLKEAPEIFYVAYEHKDNLMALSGTREEAIPAYDLNYLIDKTPNRQDDIRDTFMLGRNTDNTGWSAVYRDFVCIAKEAADAVAELLIKIHEEQNED